LEGKGAWCDIDDETLMDVRRIKSDVKWLARCTHGGGGTDGSGESGDNLGGGGGKSGGDCGSNSGCKSTGSGGVRRLMCRLRESIMRDIGGICSPRLHRHLRSGTKTLLERYSLEVARALIVVATATVVGKRKGKGNENKGSNAATGGKAAAAASAAAASAVADVGTATGTNADDSSSGIEFDEKVRFFGALRHSYGRSALVLSGGASNGYYHLGVCYTLMEQNLLPVSIVRSSPCAVIVHFVVYFYFYRIKVVLFFTLIALICP
jgi:hypothetical protein